MQDYYRVNKNNPLDKVKPIVLHNNLIEGISIKKGNNKMNHPHNKQKDIVTVDYSVYNNNSKTLSDEQAKGNNKMSNDIRQYDEMIEVEVIATINIKVTENERELFEEHWTDEKKKDFVEKMFDKVGFHPNGRIDSVNLNVNEEWEL